MLLLGLLGLCVLLEALVSWRLKAGLYEARDTELSFGLAAGWAVSGLINGALAMAVLDLAYRHRLLELGRGWLAPLAALLLADMAYYGWHRLSHHLPWLWASHFPHHTAKRLNMLASVRQGWTDALSGTWLTWAWLGLLGYSPLQVAPYFALLAVWQTFVHNEWTPRLGPLEWLFVTPSHHRVHHSLRAAHINRNYGGVLIVWDRMFGSFAPEGEAILRGFGVGGFDADASSPGEIAAREWRRLLAGRATAPG